MRYMVRLALAICCAIAALQALPAEARRVALVIGNAQYRIGPLANPVNDATAVAEALQTRLAFDKVILKTNLSFDGFRAALKELAREAAGADLGLVYFAGHGTEVAGRNFLVPVDASLTKANALDLEAVALDTVLSQLGGVRKLKLVILDACRNNPFPVAGAKRTVSRGLARIEPEDNTLVVYAAKDGTTADDGVGGGHSPFTQALLKHIATPRVEIRLLLGRVRDDVVAATNAVQTPHVYGTMGGKEFYLKTLAAVPPVVAPVPPPTQPPTQPQFSEAERAWAAVKDGSSIAALEAFKARYGGTFYADLAQVRIDELRKAAAEKKVAVAPPPPPPPQVSPPPPTPRTPAFGTPDVVFTVGMWRIVRTTLGGAGQISFWTGNGDSAVEVVLDSNGWWRVRERSQEKVVWSDGGTAPQNFYERPWQNPGGAAFPVSTTSYQGKGVDGITSIEVANDQIRIVLTDKGEIRLDARSPGIRFVTSYGRTVGFGTLRRAEDETKTAIAPPASSPPAASRTPAFGTPNAVFAVGIWRIMKTSRLGGGELYLWTGNGSVAMELVLDSNGWWRLRRRSREEVVWNSGATQAQSFEQRPWESNRSAGFPIARAAYQGRGSVGITSVDVADGRIRIVLTSRGEIHLNAQDARVTFRTPNGRTVRY